MTTTASYAGITKRQRYEILRSQLEIERSSFIPTWRDLADHQVPRRPRFTLTDTNRGERRNQKIIDSTATLALRNLAAGMMGGFTNPAKPWFRLGTPDPELNEYGPIKEWLHIVASRMATIFLRSNLYNSLPNVYTDMAAFATSAMIVEEDFDEVLRTYVFPVGSYMIAVDARGRVNVFFREFRMTVRQLVEKFGQRDASGKIDWSNFSDRVKTAWQEGRYEQWIDVCHVIAPNEDYNPKKAHQKFKKFASCYYEKGGSQDTATEDRFLRESGYDYFPVLAPRWAVTGEDSYGTSCPGMDSLGDNKALQKGERMIAEAIEKLIKPPMKGPASLKNQAPSILPGGMTFTDEREGQRGFTPVYEIDPRIGEMENKQEQMRARIRRAYFEDILLMMSYTDRREITAREVDERREEKLISFGNVLEQLNQDLLNPLIDITFALMMRQGLIPPAPEELQGMPLKVEYVSMMALAQKLSGVGGIERFASFITQLIPVVPSIVHKVDFHQLIDDYGEPLVSPKVIRSDEDVEAIMGAEAEAQAQANKVAMAREEASTVKDLSQVDLEGANPVSALLEAVRARAGRLPQQ